MKGIRLVKSPFLLRKVAGNYMHWEVPVKEKKLFLSFDDGPVPEVTPAVLDILAEYHARACFFCVGQNASKSPQLLQHILKEGHSIGNHTFHHLDGWRTPTEEYLEDIKKADRLLGTKLFRPPYGKISREQARLISQEFEIILWSVLSWDFHPKIDKDKCLNNVLRHSREGSIIVMHDSIKSMDKMLYALPRILQYFSDKGFTFEALGVDHLKKPTP